LCWALDVPAHRSFAVPLRGLCVVSGDALAPGIDDAEVVLGARIVLRRGKAPPLARRLDVLLDAISTRVQ
jgi:hypothetical protein